MTQPLHCRDCNEPIAAEDIHLGERSLAKCRHCHAVFGIADARRKPRPRPPAEPPEKYRVEEEGKELTIRYYWATWAILPLALFTLFWDGFLLAWYGVLISSLVTGHDAGEGALWVAFLFPVFHLAIGACITYAVLIQIFNSTLIRVAEGELSVEHGPIPGYTNHYLPTDQIEQLYCREQEGITSPSELRQKNGSLQLTLVAILRNGTRIDLLHSIATLEQADYLEQKLEAQLKIEDRPIGDEIDWSELATPSGLHSQAARATAQNTIESSE